MIKVVIIGQIKTTEDGLVDQLLGHQKEKHNLTDHGHQQKVGHTDIPDLGQEKDTGNLGQGHQTEIHTIETEIEILGQGQMKERGQGQEKDTRDVQGQGPRTELLKATVLVVVQ